MKGYQHILIATNLSKESQEVADRAASIAKKSAGRLSIVHIIEFNPIMYGGGEFAIPLTGDLEHSIQGQAQEALEAEGKRLGIPQKQQHLQTGSTSAKLSHLVEEQGVDLLVLGSHEQHGLTILLGSTANSLLHAMPCDVLAVHLGEYHE